jgi:NAD(P)-dependent dehydrogenase (short-subunit alcohol dehydrogenase family)
MSENSKPVWFITGCSTGFGRELARYTLERGYRVVVTARKPAEVADLVKGHEANALALALDVTKADQVAASIAAAEARFGRIDVLVNNAGVGYFAAIEESDDSQVRGMFEINFWGLANMTRAALPGMRARRSGHIVNISSMGGIRGAPAVGYYNATKFALEGLSEALAQETAPLGIKVLIVEPSGFRTDWAGRSANETQHPIADYDSTAGARQRMIRGYSGKPRARRRRHCPGRRGAGRAAAPDARQGGACRRPRQGRGARQGFRSLGRGHGGRGFPGGLIAKSSESDRADPGGPERTAPGFP